MKSFIASLLFTLLVVVSPAHTAVLVQSSNGVWTTAYTTMPAAASAPGVKAVLVTTPQVLSAPLAWPVDVPLDFSPGGYVTYTGSGALTGLKSSKPEWFGACSADTITKAIASVLDGGVVDIGDAGAVAITASIPVNKPVIIKIGAATLTANLTSQMFLVKASGVRFEGKSYGVSKLANTDTTSGNIIQWGVRGEAHQYNDLVVRRIGFTLPVITNAIDTYRTKLGAVVALTEDLTVITENTGALIEYCSFTEGADAISLEQTYSAKIQHNIFYNTKGRGVLFWNSDKYLLFDNDYIDSAGTSANFNEAFHTGSLGKGCDDGAILFNRVTGTRYEAIAVNGARTKCYGNTVVDARGTGIAVSNANESVNITHDCRVTNNIVRCIGGGVGGYGIVVTKYTTWPTPTRIDISGNDVRCSDSAASCLLVGSGATDISFSGNTWEFTGTTATTDCAVIQGGSIIKINGDRFIGTKRYALYLNGGSDIKINSCLFDNSNTSGSTHGIRATSVVGLSIGGSIVKNCNNSGVLIEGASYKLNIDAASNVFENNLANISNNTFAFLGNLSAIDSTVPPQAGYISVGQIIFRGSAQAAGASNGWVCTTAGWLVKGAWTTGTAYNAGVMVTNGGNVYQAVAAGTSGATAPTHSSGDVSDGVVTWRFVAVGTAAVVKTLPAISARLIWSLGSEVLHG